MVYSSEMTDIATSMIRGNKAGGLLALINHPDADRGWAKSRHGGKKKLLVTIDIVTNSTSGFDDNRVPQTIRRARGSSDGF